MAGFDWLQFSFPVNVGLWLFFEKKFGLWTCGGFIISSISERTNNEKQNSYTKSKSYDNTYFMHCIKE